MKEYKVIVFNKEEIKSIAKAANCSVKEFEGNVYFEDLDGYNHMPPESKIVQEVCKRYETDILGDYEIFSPGEYHYFNFYVGIMYECDAEVN